MLDGKRDKQIMHTASKHDNIVTQLGSAKGTHMYIPLGNEERTYNTEQRHIYSKLNVL